MSKSCAGKRGVSRGLRPNLLILGKGSLTSSLFKPFSCCFSTNTVTGELEAQQRYYSCRAILVVIVSQMLNSLILAFGGMGGESHNYREICSTLFISATDPPLFLGVDACRDPGEGQF